MKNGYRRVAWLLDHWYAFLPSFLRLGLASSSSILLPLFVFVSLAQIASFRFHKSENQRGDECGWMDERKAAPTCSASSTQGIAPPTRTTGFDTNNKSNFQPFLSKNRTSWRDQGLSRSAPSSLEKDLLLAWPCARYLKTELPASLETASPFDFPGHT